MRKVVLGFAVALAGLAVAVTEVEAAKRFGGGRSVGAQRNITSAPPAQTPAKTAPAQQSAAGAAQPAAQPSGMSRWMPMLGGLALGGALGWLLGANGMGGLLVGMMLVALLVFAAMFVARLLAQRRGAVAPPMQYAAVGSQGPYPAMGSETVAAPPPSQAAGFETQNPPMARAVANLPAGFDVDGFLRGAKHNYLKLQIAHDEGNLQSLCRACHRGKSASEARR